MSITRKLPRSMLAIVVVSTGLWSARLLNEAFLRHSDVLDGLWLVALRPIVVLALGFWFAALYISALENKSRVNFWTWSFVAAAIFCIPYVPDMHASFVLAGSKNALLLSIAFYLLGILTYGLIRGGACLLAGLVTSRLVKIQARALKVFVVYLFMLVSEVLFFNSWHPITYFPSLPLPLPAAQFQTTAKTEGSRVSYILFETQIDGESRSELQTGGALALSILGQRLADSVGEQLKGMEFARSVAVILPETIVSLDSVSDAGVLLRPVSEILFKNSRVEKVVWIQGAFVAQNNVVLGGEVTRDEIMSDSRSVKPLSLSVIRRKREQMPMFEAPSKGISYSSYQPQTALAEERVSESLSALKEFVNTHEIMICYESLFPAHWRRGKSTLVLTNHHLFNEYKLMNWVYVGYIRQLSFLFSSPTKIVSNFNPSGVMLPWSSQRAHAETDESGWRVVRYPTAPSR